MSLRVLFITSEIDDFVRVGGLAAVSAALPRALCRVSDIRILLPGYRDVLKHLPALQIIGRCASLAEMPSCQLGRAATSDGLPVYVLICPELYERDGGPYCDDAGRDWVDNDLRFARLASAGALLASGKIDPDWQADLVHVNDWQSALTPAYLAWNENPLPTILTIHNLAFQGLFERNTLRRIGAPNLLSISRDWNFTGRSPFSRRALSMPPI